MEHIRGARAQLRLRASYHLALFFSDLLFGAQRSWQYSKDNHILYGLMALVLVPTAFLVERSLTNPDFDTAMFRLLPTAFAIPLLIFPLLPQWIRVWFPIYWTIMLVVVFPFNYSTVLVLNAALAQGPIHPIWMFEFLFSLFILVQFTSHTRLCITMLVVGVFAGFTTLATVESPNWSSLYENVLLPAPVFLTTFVVLLVSNRHIFKAQEEKLIALQFMGSNIAHELRTPLATIRNTSTGTDNQLPKLIDAYKAARSQGMEVSPIRQSQLSTLNEALTIIADEVDHANCIIDILLLNTLDRPSIALEIHSVSAKELVENAVKEFPFNNSLERSLVNFGCKSDFTLHAPAKLAKHIIFNVLKNAVQHAQKVSKPRINLLVDGVDRSISITDNGPGIARSEVKKIFERFYTTARIGDGNGIGLSFCKIAMESIDGTIICTSSAKSGTSFIMTFPETPPKLLPRIAKTPDLNW
jgi:two-component system, CAI-1 autoinducer sensor kinase/phosphatase CqsS